MLENHPDTVGTAGAIASIGWLETLTPDELVGLKGFSAVLPVDLLDTRLPDLEVQDTSPPKLRLIQLPNEDEWSRLAPDKSEIRRRFQALADELLFGLGQQPTLTIFKGTSDPSDSA